MRISVEVPEALVVRDLTEVKNQLSGLRQTRAWWTVRRFLIIGVVNAVAGIVNDGLNRVTAATGTDSRVYTLVSVPNPNPSASIREVREPNPRSTSVLRPRR